MTTSRVRPESLEQLEQGLRTAVEIIFRKQEAWRSSRFAVSRDESVVVLISHWDSAEAYEALVATPEYTDAMASLSHNLEAAPVVAIYEERFSFGD